MLLSKKNGIRVKRILFQLLVLLFPIQLSRHFWPSWAYVSGIRIDYLAPAVYLTDILLVLLLSVWFIEKTTKTKLFNAFYKKRKTLLVSAAIFLFSVLNITGAENSQAALFKWIKLLEMFAFTFFVIKNRNSVSRDFLFYPLSIAIIYTTAIGIAQFVLQTTIGGPLYFLGERTFSSSTPGIALGTYFGSQLLRPYATFPHPNALAGFLIVSFFLVSGKKTKKLQERIVKILASVCSLFLVLLSNSRGALLALLVSGFIYLLSKHRLSFARSAVLLLVISAMTLSLISPVFFQKYLSQNTYLPESAERRVSLTVASGQMTAERPTFGVGLNNFLIILKDRGTLFDLYWFLQPVHNIFLLVFAELGLFGLFLFIFILAEVFRNLYARKEGAIPLVLSLLAIILTGLVDHYWLTLQQTQLLFSLVLGLSLRKNG